MLILKTNTLITEVSTSKKALIHVGVELNYFFDSMIVAMLNDFHIRVNGNCYIIDMSITLNCRNDSNIV